MQHFTWMAESWILLTRQSQYKTIILTIYFQYLWRNNSYPELYAQSPGFDPTGGTVEIYGDNNGQVVTSNGAYFHNLKINTDPLPFYTNIYSCNINNDLIIEEGSVSLIFGNTMQCGNVIVNSGGDLRFNSVNPQNEKQWNHQYKFRRKYDSGYEGENSLLPASILQTVMVSM